MGTIRLLIIAESVAPVQAIAAVRWTKFAKYLSRLEDFEVSILTNQKDFDGSHPCLKQYSYDSTSVHDLDSSTVSFISMSRYQSLANRLYNLVTNCLFRQRSKIPSSRSNGKKNRPIVSFLMKLQVFADWLTGDAMMRSALKDPSVFENYDCVISTYGPRWPHRVGHRIKELFPSVKWIADFRDPPVSSAKSDSIFNHSYADNITVNSDCLIVVGEEGTENLFLTHNQKIVVLTNGFDCEPDAAPIDDESCSKETLTFTYTGTLYADDTCLRDIAPLFKALTELLINGKIEQNNILVEYAGNTPDLFLSAAKAFPNVPIKSYGLLKRSEALELQSNAGALVVCTWNTSEQKGVLTGKIFEYMRSGVPVIGLCSGDSPDSELRRMIESCHIGMCYEEADDHSYEELKDYLCNLYKSWSDTGSTSLGEDARQLVTAYSYPVLSSKLARIIKDLVSS